mmetsp:Transcript_775/g.928  ORF Transcript_775/g.928 Transcript_775/m.928 type:complete len:439 (+) Transcript_775:37-1353(+)
MVESSSAEANDSNSIPESILTTPVKSPIKSSPLSNVSPLSLARKRYTAHLTNDYSKKVKDGWAPEEVMALFHETNGVDKQMKRSKTVSNIFMNLKPPDKNESFPRMKRFKSVPDVFRSEPRKSASRQVNEQHVKTTMRCRRETQMKRSKTASDVFSKSNKNESFARLRKSGSVSDIHNNNRADSNSNSLTYVHKHAKESEALLSTFMDSSQKIEKIEADQILNQRDDDEDAFTINSYESLRELMKGDSSLDLAEEILDFFGSQNKLRMGEKSRIREKDATTAAKFNPVDIEVNQNLCVGDGGFDAKYNLEQKMEDSVKKGNALTKSTLPDHENLLSEQHNCKEREKSLKTNYTSPSIPLLGHDHSFTELHRCARRKQKRKKARKEKRQRRKKTEERHHVVRSNSSLSTCSINNGRRDQSHTTLVKSKNAKEKQSEDDH